MWVEGGAGGSKSARLKATSEPSDADLAVSLQLKNVELATRPWLSGEKRLRQNTKPCILEQQWAKPSDLSATRRFGKFAQLKQMDGAF